MNCIEAVVKIMTTRRISMYIFISGKIHEDCRIHEAKE